MTTSIINDLKMAEISLAKVQDLDKLQTEAKEILDNYRTSIRVRDEVTDALATIEAAPDYKLTPAIAKEVDSVINTNGHLVVQEGKAVVQVHGTEAFGLSVTPAEWRKLRTFALNEMLADSYKDIKRWANALSENFNRRWIELMTSTEVLETRLESLDGTIDIVGSIKSGAKSIILTDAIAKSISKGNRTYTKDIGKNVQGELNYTFGCLKVWEMEQIKFKNSVIRYFGNARNNDITDIKREIPRLFDVKAQSQENLVARRSREMLDGYCFEGIELDPKFAKLYKGDVPDESRTVYAEKLAETGYTVNSCRDNKIGKVEVDVMSLSDIYILRDVVSKIIDRLKSMNEEHDPVNFNPDDVKDVLATLKESDTSEDRAYQYGIITADYQFDVNAFKTGVSNMLTVQASHLISLMNLHLECYDVEL